MTETVAAAAPPPAPPAQPVPVAQPAVSHLRTYLLAGCSVGGTLCASLASAGTINLPFAVASAVFGGLIVVMTAAPSPVAALAQVASVQPGTATPAAAAMRQGGLGVVGIGISAAVISFIMNQVAQFSVGWAVFNIAGDVPAEYMLTTSSIIALAVLGVRIPFDLLLGAYLLARARNVFAALGIFIVAYLVCYLVEQALSMTVGASGLYNTLVELGFQAVFPGLLFVLGVPLLAQAAGALGARFAGRLTRPRT